MASGHRNVVAGSVQGQTIPQNPETPQALKTWWAGFKKKTKKDPEPAPEVEEQSSIFGVALQDSIKYANVAISLTNDTGESFIYGYVPIVVAKCGVFLKENATDVEGIFRLSGSAKRIRELQTIFDSPDRFGKGLNWTGYTVHDAANILRRYINQLPEPVVPLNFYQRFRDPLRRHQTQAVGDVEAQTRGAGDFNLENAISAYQRLITELPNLNRQLLLYILDLLAVFASKSDINLMTSANLSAIFQPGLLSHPDHDMAPQEYRLSQDVIIFLINNQDSFLIGMNGTAADEKSVREVQNAAQNRQTSTPPHARGSPSGLGRSTSNASAGAESLRKFGGIRRNLSVSSKNSKKSSNIPSPVTSSSGTAFASGNTGSGIHRSNTVPSNRSPGLSSTRFNRVLDSPTTPSAVLSPGSLTRTVVRTSSPSSKLAKPTTEVLVTSTSSSTTPTLEHSNNLVAGGGAATRDQSNERLIASNDQHLNMAPVSENGQQLGLTPPKTRNISSLLTRSPASEERKPNKLRKKRQPSTNPSANSSTNSLHNTPDSPANPAFYTPMPTPGLGPQTPTDPLASAIPPVLSNTAATPRSENGPDHVDGAKDLKPTKDLNSMLKPNKSPPVSVHSKSSITDHSEPDHLDDGIAAPERSAKKSRWRFSSPAKKVTQGGSATTASSSHVGSNAVAEMSTSSIGSWSKSRKSITNDSNQLGTEPSSIGFPATLPSQQQTFKEGVSQKEKEISQDANEKKGPLGWIKAKVAQVKEDRKEREAEKERSKTPPRNGADRTGSKQSLGTTAQDVLPTRGRSMEVKREGNPEAEAEPPMPHDNSS